jgi:hypothetical protein
MPRPRRVPRRQLCRRDDLVGPVRFELTSLRLKGECRYPLCDEPKMVSAAGFEPASSCLRGRYNQPLYDALMVYVAGVEPADCPL